CPATPTGSSATNAEDLHTDRRHRLLARILEPGALHAGVPSVHQKHAGTAAFYLKTTDFARPSPHSIGVRSFLTGRRTFSTYSQALPGYRPTRLRRRRSRDHDRQC